MHTELRRPGVTLELLHLEYLARYRDGYRYSAFCRHDLRWVVRQRGSMRLVHRAGEKTFVDDSGKKPHVVDPATAARSPWGRSHNEGSIRVSQRYLGAFQGFSWVI